MRDRKFLLIVAAMVPMGSVALWGADSAAPQVSSPTLHAVDFSGNTAVDSGTLAKRISIKPPGPYDPAQVRFSIDVLESVYRDIGYAEVRVSTRTVFLSADQVDVHFQMEEGALFRIRTITVEGNHRIAEKLVRRDLGIAAGDPFSQTRIYEGNRQLFLSGYFETADIRYSSAPLNRMDVHVRVKERPTQYVKGGFGYGTQTKERASVGYEDRNFFGHETQLDVRAVHSGFLTNPHKYRTTILETSVAQPHFLDTSLEGQTSIAEEWDSRDPYDSRTTSWRSSLGRRFGRSITASLRYRYQGTRISRIDPAAALTTLPFTNVSAAGPTFTYDDTDDPFLPTKGWRISGLLEKGFRLGLGDVNFQRFEARVGRFEPTVAQVTLFAGLQAGIVRPDEKQASIPIFERYTLGGGSTVRGYEEKELGPKDAQGSPLGGNAFFVGNFELRHRLYKTLYGVWFLDGGQLYVQAPGSAWPSIRAKGLNDFAFGTGPGLRFHTPVGAIRLEIGYKLNPPGQDGTFFQRTSIHFSLGEVF